MLHSSVYERKGDNPSSLYGVNGVDNEFIKYILLDNSMILRLNN